MSEKYEMTIGGETVPAGEYTEVRNPANTEEVVGLAPVGSNDHLEQAISAARRAFGTWRYSSDQDRAEACQAIAKVVTDNAPELAMLLTKEQGKCLKGLGSEFEMGGCAGWAGYTAGMSLPVKVLEDSEASKIEMHREPLGVVGSITVVIKPSPFTPLSTLRMFQLISEALPPGLVNVISGGDALGASLSQHAGINKVVFTGSIATGKKVMESAAPTLKPLTLELGGNDPAIVLPDTDPGPFVEGLFFGSMINSGQTCGAIKRLYVHDGHPS